MSYAPFPSSDASDLGDQARAAGLRLSDAEKIASVRLGAEGDGSLKEALAGVSEGELPRNEIDRLTDRIEAAQSSYSSAGIEPTLPFLDEPALQAMASEPWDVALLDLREWGEARAQVAAELAELQSQPLFLHEDARQIAGGTHWQRAARDAEPYQHATHVAAEHAAAVAPEPVVRATAPDQGTTAPIAEAFDSAAKLAADANAAAVALENLTRLLQEHQRPASIVPLPKQVAQPLPMPATAPRPKRVAQRPVAPAQRPNTRKSAARVVTAPTLRPVPVPHDARQFDLRGFMAGFALSWAIGAVLYIYLLAG